MYSSNAPQGEGSKKEAIPDRTESKDLNPGAVMDITDNIKEEYEPGRKGISSYYNHKFITEGLRVPWLIVINNKNVHTIIDRIFKSQEVSGGNYKSHLAKNFEQAKLHLAEEFEFKLLGDLECLE